MASEEPQPKAVQEQPDSDLGKPDAELERKIVKEVERRRLEAERRAKASLLTDPWYRGPVVSLKSEKLSTAVQAMASPGDMTLQKGATPLTSAGLSPAQFDDLNAATAGLLQAYATGLADSVFDYMDERGKSFDAKMRGPMERLLAKATPSVPIATLSDRELFCKVWDVQKCSIPWLSLATEPSSRQIWDGRSLPAKELRRFTISELAEPGAPGAKLMSVLRGSNSYRSHFIPIKGSLDEDLATDNTVMLVDTLFILEYNETFGRLRSPWLCRFWWNPSVNKWQPIDLMTFYHPDLRIHVELMF